MRTWARACAVVSDGSVVGVLMEFLNGEGAMDVILFVRSIVEQYEVCARRYGGCCFSSLHRGSGSVAV